MGLGFGEALLLFGLLLSVAAGLSGVMRGTVLSVSVLSVGLGVVLALGDVITRLPAALSRRIDPRAGLSLVWGRVRAGTSPNVIPDRGEVSGTVMSVNLTYVILQTDNGVLHVPNAGVLASAISTGVPTPK